MASRIVGVEGTAGSVGTTAVLYSLEYRIEERRDSR